MKKKNYIYLCGTVALFSAVTAFQGCSDDHFDINEDVAGKESLWSNIKSNESLSQFANILNRINVSKSEGSVTTQTYADLFSNDQTFTIWAPENNSFNYNYYDSLINVGTTASLYKVEKELIRNCMTRYSYVLSGSESTDLFLFNDKKAVFDRANSKINDIDIVKPNIGANNGVLHITDGAVQYQPNIYEFMAERSETDSLNAFIKGYEKIKFNDYQSTQGPTINGTITWVDSVTNMSNEYLYMINAYINSEDSNYVMIMPTNKAWSETLEKTQKFFNYKDSYSQKITSVNSNGDTNEETIETALSKEEIDSMVNLYSKNAITNNLVFNAKYQFGHNYEDFSVEGKCDSLMSTTYNVFYDPYSARLFDGVTPISLSNGYAYIVDNFNYRTTDSWGKDKKVEAEYNSNIETYTGCTPTSSKLNLALSFSEGDYSVDTLIESTVMKTVQTSSSSNPSITFQITNTMSCKYDIYVLMAYNREAMKPNLFRATINYHNLDKKDAISQNLESGYGDGKSFENAAPHFDENGKFVYTDSILIAKDFEFPVAYMGLDNAYITLKLNSFVSSKQTDSYTREMWIDKILLKVKDE